MSGANMAPIAAASPLAIAASKARLLAAIAAALIAQFPYDLLAGILLGGSDDLRGELKHLPRTRTPFKHEQRHRRPYREAHPLQPQWNFAPSLPASE